MSWSERIEQAQGSITAALASATVAGFIWLVRRVFTNQKQIEMLQREIQVRDERREDDRKILDEIKTEMKELRTDVKVLFQRNPL